MAVVGINPPPGFTPPGINPSNPNGPTAPVGATPPSGIAPSSQTTALVRAMWNWAIHYPSVLGRAMTREDWVNTWGDLGGSTFDWGSTIASQGTNPSLDEATWLSTVGGLATKAKVGGAVGQYYAPADTGPAVQGTYGNLGADMYSWGQQHLGQGITRQDWQNTWGDIGGAFYDWAKNFGGGWPADRSTAISQIDFMADTYGPGGTIGVAYTAATTPQGKIDAANLARINQEIDNARASGALTDAQVAQVKAQIANMATVEQAQALIKQNIDNAASQGLINAATLAKLNADLANMPTAGEAHAQIAANLAQINAQIDALVQQGALAQANADKIKADIANMPTPEQAKAKFDAEVNNLVFSGQLTQAQAAQAIASAGLATAQTAEIGANIAANPRDFMKQWFYQQGQQPPAPAPAPTGTMAPASAGLPTPPWLKSLQTNTPQPAFSATAGNLATPGGPGLTLPAPNQVSAKAYNSLLPSEQQGLEGLASSQGWYTPDYITQMQKSWQKQNVNTTPMWAGF